VDNLPLYDTTDDDESSPVISGTSGGNEHTKILNDGEGSTFKVEPTNSATKKKSQRKPKLKVKYLILNFIPCTFVVSYSSFLLLVLTSITFFILLIMFL